MRFIAFIQFIVLTFRSWVMLNKKIIVDKLKELLKEHCGSQQLFFLSTYQMGQLQNIQLVSQLNILLDKVQDYDLSFNCYEILKEHLPLSFVDAYFDYSLIENNNCRTTLDLDSFFDFTAHNAGG